MRDEAAKKRDRAAKALRREPFTISVPLTPEERATIEAFVEHAGVSKAFLARKGMLEYIERHVEADANEEVAHG